MGRRSSQQADNFTADEDLVRGALAGEEQAWDELIDRYASYILAIISRAFGIGGHAAEEIFQDVCVRMFDGLGGFAGRAPFRSWLRAVTLSACREHLRKAARTSPAEVDPEASDELGQLETALVVRSAVTQLGDPCRVTLELHFFEDLTQAEVAKRLGAPPGTIAARVSRCLNRLKEALQERPAAGTSRDV